MSEVDLSVLWASDETRRIDLTADGSFWVEVKKELDHGEEQAMQASVFDGMTQKQLSDAVDDTEQVMKMNVAKLHFMKLGFYVVDWNLVDESGRPMTLPARLEDRIKLMKKLKPAIGNKISAGIDAIREEAAKESDPNATGPERAMTSNSLITATDHTEVVTSNGAETRTGVTS